MAESYKKMQIMVIDDNVTNLHIARKALENLHDVTLVQTGEKALYLFERFTPDLILLDVDMPGISGFDLIKKIKNLPPPTRDIAVIFLTAVDDTKSEFEGLNLGAVDYITKPLSFPLLQKRVELHLSLVKQQRELHNYSHNLEKMVEAKANVITELQNAIVTVLSNMVERRDGSSAGHLVRTKKYMNLFLHIVKDANIYPEELENINIDLFTQASQLHDVGNMSIPDDILLKPGKLTPAEFEIIKSHTSIGEEAIMYAMSNVQEKRFLEVAATIAGSHHEKWNGSGYPRGLCENEIPIEGRLMAIVDVYDALISGRPYKLPYTHEQSLSILKAGQGTHFDPALLKVFFKTSDIFAKISQSCHLKCDSASNRGVIYG